MSTRENIRLIARSSLPFCILIDFLLTVKTATLMSISGRGSAISSAKEGNSGFLYNLGKVNKLFGPRNYKTFLD